MSRRDRRRARRQERRRNRRSRFTEGVRNIGSSIRDTAAEARDRAEAARERAEAAARRRAAEARRRAAEARRRAEEAAEEARARAEAAAEEARRAAREAADEARDRLDEAQNTTEDTAEEVREAIRRGVTIGRDRFGRGRDWVRAREERIVRRGERALVIFSEFKEETESDWAYERLYGFAERMGVSLAVGLLGPIYDRVVPVTGSTATLSELIETMRDVLDDPDIDEVDLLWHGHGTEADAEPLDPGLSDADREEAEEQDQKDGRIRDVHFSMAPDAGHEHWTHRQGDVTLTDIANAFDDLDADTRLRMFYTTACYGTDLAEALMDAGFSCGAGARAINTNAALEYPRFLKEWAQGRAFGDAVSVALARSRYRQIDRQVAQRTSGQGDRFSDTDSFKEQFGDTGLHIGSNAEF